MIMEFWRAGPNHFLLIVAYICFDTFVKAARRLRLCQCLFIAVRAANVLTDIKKLRICAVQMILF